MKQHIHGMEAQHDFKPWRPLFGHSDRAKLRKADLRGSQISGLNLAVLSDYAGLSISESEQSEILKQLGVDVRPE